MMKIIVKILITFMLGGLTVASFNCTSVSDTAPEYQAVTVQHGDLLIDITAVGNLALSLKEDLAFEISSTVEEVLVEEGDTVEEGQILAKLDTSDWEDNLAALEDKVTAAERQVTAAKRQLRTKERSLTASEGQLEIKKRSVTAKERDVIQAEINLKNAEITLEQTNTTYSVSDYKVAQADVDVAEDNLEDALRKLAKYILGTEGYLSYQKIVLQAQARVNTTEAKLEAMLSGLDTEEVAIKKLQVEIAMGKLEEARQTVNDALVAVEYAQKDIEDAQIAVEDAQVAVDDARKDEKDAREALLEARNTGLEIIAPFAGFVTKVNVAGGDEVKKGGVAVQLADPAKFEADILVSEMDILQVKLGTGASVEVDAMSGISLPAKVTHISPTATIQSGVVNYKLKVEIQSLEAEIPKQRERQEERPGTMPPFSSGELPERVRRAIEEGSITQEQIDEMRRQRQQGAGGLPKKQPEQMPGMLPKDFQLREGLTVTVSILVDERQDVLLVPNQAITRQGSETYVNVLEDGVVEERSIQTGISDWQFTEVTDGISEGEKVVISETTATTSSEPQPRGPFPFMGGGGRR